MLEVVKALTVYGQCIYYDRQL